MQACPEAKISETIGKRSILADKGQVHTRFIRPANPVTIACLIIIDIVFLPDGYAGAGSCQKVYKNPLFCRFSEENKLANIRGPERKQVMCFVGDK